MGVDGGPVSHRGMRVDPTEVALVRPQRLPLRGEHIDPSAKANDGLVLERAAKVTLETDPRGVSGENESGAAGQSNENVQAGR